MARMLRQRQSFKQNGFAFLVARHHVKLGFFFYPSFFFPFPKTTVSQCFISFFKKNVFGKFREKNWWENLWKIWNSARRRLWKINTDIFDNFRIILYTKRSLKSNHSKWLRILFKALLKLIMYLELSSIHILKLNIQTPLRIIEIRISTLDFVNLEFKLSFKTQSLVCCEMESETVIFVLNFMLHWSLVWVVSPYPSNSSL